MDLLVIGTIVCVGWMAVAVDGGDALPSGRTGRRRYPSGRRRISCGAHDIRAQPRSLARCRALRTLAPVAALPRRQARLRRRRPKVSAPSAAIPPPSTNPATAGGDHRLLLMSA